MKDVAMLLLMRRNLRTPERSAHSRRCGNWQLKTGAWKNDWFCKRKEILSAKTRKRISHVTKEYYICVH